MYHSFLTHSFAAGHLGCFQYLAIVNCAAMNIGVHRFFWIGVSGFLAYNPSNGITGLKSSTTFRFLRTLHTLFHSGYTSLHSHQQCTRVPFTPHPLQYLFVDLFMMSILSSVKWYLIVALICFSLMASDAEHLFMYLWALCISSLEKRLFRFFVCFLIELFLFLEWSHVNSLYILEFKLLSAISLAKYIFPYSWFLFHFADVFFSHAETFYFNEIPFISSFMFLALCFLFLYVSWTYRWKYCCMEYLLRLIITYLLSFFLYAYVPLSLSLLLLLKEDTLIFLVMLVWW